MAHTRGKCYICTEAKPVQSHHLAPLEYGGPKDGPQITLCPTCHLTCHYEAEIYYKTGDYGDLEGQYQGAAFERAKKVVHKIVNTRLLFENHGKPAKDARRRVNINLSHEELQLLHSLKKQKGFKSLERLVRAAIMVQLRDARKRGEV